MRSGLRGWRHSVDMRRRRRRRERGYRSTIPQNMLHLLRIVQTINRIVISRRSFPQHDTTKGIRIQVHVRSHKRLHLLRTKIEALSSCVLSGRKANIELCRWVFAVPNHLHPVIVVEMASVARKVSR